MTTKIAGVIQARLSSERCRGKTLRPFAGTTLIDLALRKFALPERSFPLYYAVHEEQLLGVGRAYRQMGADMKIIKRDEASARSDDVKVVLNYVDEIDADYILWINPCHAFLTLETLEEAIKCTESSATHVTSMTAVTYKHTWYYHLDGRPINFTDPTKLDTKATTPLIEVAHAFHVFNKARFMKYGYFWTHRPLDPFFFMIPDKEAIDVDTELDFVMAEALYLRMKERD